MQSIAAALLLLAAPPSAGAAPEVPSEAAGAAPSAAGVEVRCELRGDARVVGRLAGAQGRARAAVDARLGESIEVFVQVPGRLDGRRVVFSEDGARGHVSWVDSGCPPAEVRWRRVEPTMEHVDTEPPNQGLSIYANAVMFGPKHGAWIGYDRLEYNASPIAEADDRWTWSVAEAGPSDSELRASRGAGMEHLGVMRLSAHVTPQGGASRRSPGAEGAGRGGVGEDVFRYTIRGGDDVFGWLTSFFNVPYVFGSAGVGARAQAERYIGADCADVIVAALRRAGHRDFAYTSVAGLIRGLPRAAEPIVLDPSQGEANPARSAYTPLPGDILAIDYIGSASLPRPWDHVVVFVEDRGPDGQADGVLGPEDQVADTGDARGLRFSALGHQGHVRVLPLRPGSLRR